MRKSAPPDIRGLNIVHTGETPTEELPPDIQVLKETKVGAFNYFETTSAQIAAAAKLDRDKSGYRKSDSHDRPHEILRSRNASARRTRKLGDLGNPSITQRVDGDPRLDAVIEAEILDRSQVTTPVVSRAAKAATNG